MASSSHILVLIILPANTSAGTPYMMDGKFQQAEYGDTHRL